METSNVKEHCTVEYISYELQRFFNQDYNFLAVHKPKKIEINGYNLTGLFNTQLKYKRLRFNP